MKKEVGESKENERLLEKEEERIRELEREIQEEEGKKPFDIDAID